MDVKKLAYFACVWTTIYVSLKPTLKKLYIVLNLKGGIFLFTGTK